MTDSEDVDTLDIDDGAFVDLFRPVFYHLRQIGQGTLICVVLAGLLGGVYLLFQPTSWTTSLGFRPIFQGANGGVYPNLMPFSTTDITDPSVVDQVIATNDLETYCASDVFRAAVFVEEESPDLQFLISEYDLLLSDARVTQVERQRLQGEYASRRSALQAQYRLTFIQPDECARMPQVLVSKAMTEILETWASDSLNKRGVARLRVPVLTPAIFNQNPDPTENLLIRADLLRTAIRRVISNVSAVEALPGAELIRGSDADITFQEVRMSLEDLVQARLGPVVAQIGRDLGNDALAYLEQAVLGATIERQAAESRAEAYRMALREYSGVTATPTSSAEASGRQRNPGDVQALTPQIDRTFIEGIVELSAANTTFRQELTRDAVSAAVEAVNQGVIIEEYAQLISSIGRAEYESIPGQLNSTLLRISEQGREATRRFNEIYNDFSRLSLRTGPVMYRIEQPIHATRLRSFSLRRYAYVVFVAATATPVILAMFFLVRGRWRATDQGVRKPAS